MWLTLALIEVLWQAPENQLETRHPSGSSALTDLYFGNFVVTLRKRSLSLLRNNVTEAGKACLQPRMTGYYL
jgi:hypothetical protein